LDYRIDFILLALIYFVFFYRRWRRRSIKELVINTIMYIYIVMVLFVTLMPFPIPFGATNNLFIETANVIPFRDLALNYDGAVREIILNVIMMMPFGFLYPIIRKKGILITIVLVFFFSLFIESSQLLSAWWGSLYSRSFDVTDLITNTFGGLIGYLIYIALKPVINKVLKE
jgi:glycopeptide antibiotics resistance protein